MYASSPAGHVRCAAVQSYRSMVLILAAGHTHTQHMISFETRLQDLHALMKVHNCTCASCKGALMHIYAAVPIKGLMCDADFILHLPSSLLSQHMRAVLLQTESAVTLPKGLQLATTWP